LSLVKYGVTITTQDMAVSPATQAESNNIVFVTTVELYGYKGTVIWTIANVDYLHPTVTADFKEVVKTSLSSIKNSANPVALFVRAEANTLLQDKLSIFCTTSNYGADVLEVVAVLRTREQYPNQYPKDLIALLEGVHITSIFDQPFLKPVRFHTIMRGCGKHDLERAMKIKCEFHIKRNLIEFYQDLCDYMTLRFVLSGLLYSIWEEKWLLGKYYANFLKDLKASPFSSLSNLFEAGGLYYGFENYMLYDL